MEIYLPFFMDFYLPFTIGVPELSLVKNYLFLYHDISINSTSELLKYTDIIDINSYKNNSMTIMFSAELISIVLTSLSLIFTQMTLLFIKTQGGLMI